MAKINFVVGEIGSGYTEVAGQLLQILRKQEPVFGQILPQLENRIYFGYVSEYGDEPFTEMKAMQAAGTDFTYESVKAELQKVLTDNLVATNFVLIGTGISLYIDRLLKDFPDCTVYFVKRDNPADVMGSVDYFASKHIVFDPSDVKTQIPALNTRITASIDSAMSGLGIEWASGDKSLVNGTPSETNNAHNKTEEEVLTTYTFFFPTSVAVYTKPLMF